MVLVNQPAHRELLEAYARLLRRCRRSEYSNYATQVVGQPCGG